MNNERKESYISDKAIDEMINQLQDGIDRHYDTCSICKVHIPFDADRRYRFCRDVTHMVFMQARWIEERRIRQHGKTTIRAHD